MTRQQDSTIASNCEQIHILRAEQQMLETQSGSSSSQRDTESYNSCIVQPLPKKNQADVSRIFESAPSSNKMSSSHKDNGDTLTGSSGNLQMTSEAAAGEDVVVSSMEMMAAQSLISASMASTTQCSNQQPSAAMATSRNSTTGRGDVNNNISAASMEPTSQSKVRDHPVRPEAPAPHSNATRQIPSNQLRSSPSTDRPSATSSITTRNVFLPLGPERRMTFFRISDFTLIRSLGTGTFGRVYLARFGDLEKYFALKKMRKIDVLRLQQVEHVRDERSLLSRLSHPFIVKLYTALQDELHLYMVMEYASGGELFHYLRRAHRFDLNTARFYAAELVSALEYLHSHGVAYRDLKPENLLLDVSGHLKLADFGFAKIVPQLTYTLCGTPEYLAPEIIRGHGYNMSGDWWALGILIFEMLTGNPPFVGPTPTAVYEQTLAGRITTTHGVRLDRETREIISGLLTADVSRRLGCTDGGVAVIKSLPFFRGVDWTLVSQRAYRPPIIPVQEASLEGAVNFPKDDNASSMDVHFDNELHIVRSHGIPFHGFQQD